MNYITDKLLKSFLSLAALAASVAPTGAADYTIKAGSTDVSVYVYIPPTSDGSGGLASANYVRPGATPQSFLSTELAALNSAHADGKWKLVSGDTGAVFRLDLPDAAVAAGARSVDIVVHDSGGFVGHLTIDLVGYDPTVANLPANVTQISGDQTTADNAEAFFDGRGYGGHIISGTLDSVMSQTSIAITVPVSGTMADDDLKDCRVLLREGNQKGIRRITTSSASYSGAELVDLTLDAALPWNVTTAATYTVLPPDFRTEDRTSLLAVKTKTDNLPSAAPGTATGLFIAGTNAATSVNFTGNITGNLIGTVTTVTNLTNLPSIPANWLTAAGIATGAFTDDEFNVTGSEFTAIPWNAAWDAEVESEAADALIAFNLDHLVGTSTGIPAVPAGTFLDQIMDDGTAVFDRTTDSLQAQRENFDDVLDGAPTFAEAMDAQGYTTARAEKIDRLAPTLLVSTTIDGAPTSQTEFVLDDGPPDDNALNGALVIVTSGSHKAVGIVRDYDESSKTVTLVTDPGIFTMASGDQVDIIAGGPVPLWLGGSP